MFDAAAGGLQAALPRLVLASGSTTRRALLAASGLRFDVHVPDVDERALKDATRAVSGTAEDAAVSLATLKAGTVRDEDAVVIGCDQILVCEGHWYDKPADLVAARRQLMQLRGRVHTLITAIICMRGGQKVFRHLAKPQLKMRNFSGEFLEAYLAAEGEAVLSSVGAYRLEGVGVHLFERVEGEQSAILGLPMPALLGFLRQCGVVTG
jgi:septum formation protein